MIRTFLSLIGILLLGWYAAPGAIAGNVAFVSPANGTLDVSRFPAISIGFNASIACDQTSLQNGIKLFDRAGQSVALNIRCSGYDSQVVILSPGGPVNRLEPAADYFLEIGLGQSDPAQYTRVHFQTGGLKSIFCIEKETESWGADVCTQNNPSVWKNSCDENYYLRYDTGDPSITSHTGICSYSSVPVPPSDPDSTCGCSILPNQVVGGLQGNCVCARENTFAAGLWTDYAVIKGVFPAAGINLTSLGNPITITLDRDIGTSAASYTVTVRDITRPDLDPATVASGTPTYSSAARTFSYAGATLQSNKRYRVTLDLAGTAIPTTRILMPQAHHFEWTFNTWTGPQGPFASYEPTPRTDGVSFPTQLPVWPHLRFLYNGPVSKGLADTDGAPFIVKDYQGNAIYGSSAWIDQDMTRIHLVVYSTLTEGKRYEVFCTSGFVTATNGLCNTTTPIARFLTQVTPPDLGTSDIRTGSRFSISHSTEAWLAVRPTVINQPYGLKERYSTDGNGPTSFLGHVMLVPEAPSVVGSITVDPNATGSSCGQSGCRRLCAQPDPRCGSDNYYLTSTTSCTSNSQCPVGYACSACPGQGNPACPNGQNRCLWDYNAYSTELTQFCHDIIDGGMSACTIQDAYRCVAGGNDACDTNKDKMNAPQGQCPSTHLWDSANNCVPRGTIAINLAAGSHLALIDATTNNARSYDPSVSAFVAHASPVVIQPKQVDAVNAVQATYTATRPLPGAGLAIPVETCKTTGKGTTTTTCTNNSDCDYLSRCVSNVCVNAEPQYACPNSLGVCDRSSLQCRLIEQGLEPVTNGTCSSPSGCSQGYKCNEGLCKQPCSSNKDCDPGFVCGGSYCGKPLNCAGDGDCFDGFHCITNPDDASRNVCAANDTGPATAFSCSGGTCTSKWMQVDSVHNIWRIWWPDKKTDAGGRQLRFAARIDDGAGGPLRPLPSFRLFEKGDCVYDPDPETCWRNECNAWNAMTYRQQVDELVIELGDDTLHPAPYAAYASGYRLFTGNVSFTPDTCDIGFIGAISEVSEFDQDGPKGVFVKLPTGKTPSNYQIEATKDYSMGYFVDPFDLTFRGLNLAGISEGLDISDSDYLTFRGDQFFSSDRDPIATAGVISESTSTPGSTQQVTFSDNYLRATAALTGATRTSSIALTNNVWWKTRSKIEALTFACADVTQVPSVCNSATDPTCIRPACRTNTDCRIPFWNGSTLTSDPTFAGTGATCVIGANGLGTCDYGVTKQGLFMDNVALDSTGVDWSSYSLRLQRNHFENNTGQEVYDAGSGVSYVSFLDNVSFHYGTDIGIVLTGSWPIYHSETCPQRPSGFGRSLAVENNSFIHNSPGYRAVVKRKNYPDDQSVWMSSPSAVVFGPPVTDAEGFRQVGNVFIGDPGAPEIDSLTGVTDLQNWRKSLLSKNTAVADSFSGFWTEDMIDSVNGWQSSGALPSMGMTSNLVLSSSRLSMVDNRCAPGRGDDLSAQSPATIEVGSNASLYKFNLPAGYQCLRLEDRRKMFREPVPSSPSIDYETFQKRLVPTTLEVLGKYRAWPSYDPAYLDDLLHVRAKHAACGYGAYGTDCVDNDSDSDLYSGTADNCPTVANVSQTDTDGDGIGDACDTCTDRDHDNYGDPAFPTTGCSAGTAGDCLDTNAAVNPGATEGPTSLSTCYDGLDNNCNGTTDLDCAINVVPSSPGIGPGTITCGSDSNLGAATANNTYECLQESLQSGNYRLQSIWTLNVSGTPSGVNYDLRVDGYRNSTSNDDFNFSSSNRSTSGNCTSSEGGTTAILTVNAPGPPDPNLLKVASLGIAPSSAFCVKTVDSKISGDSGSQDTMTLDRLFAFPTPVALSDAASGDQGTVTSGSYASTQRSENVSETIREEQLSGAYRLWHTWRFDNVPSGIGHVLHFEGLRTLLSGNKIDDFNFQWSTSPTSGFANTGATIASTTEITGDSPSFGTSGLSGTIYIRVIDAQKTNTSLSQSSVTIDHIVIKTVP